VGTEPSRSSESSHGVRDRALRRVLAEIHAGLRHGYFSFTLTCEVIGHGRRRLVLHAGKNYQFVIPAEECKETERLIYGHEPIVEDSAADE
jgi:hypothetical protein